MSLQFILGGAGVGKSHFLYERIIEDSMKYKDKNYLVIVPEQFTLQTQKNLVDKHPRKSIMNIDVLSFMRLAFRVFEEQGGCNRTVLEDTGKCMIVKKVMLEKKKELVLYGSNVNKQGFIDEMKSILSELFQYSIGMTQLEQMKESAKEQIVLCNKLKDIITIYQGFRDFLEEKYITAEELLDVLCEVIDESSFVKNTVLCFDGFTGFTPSQYKLIAHLLKQAQKIYISITIDARSLKHVQEEHHLFYLSEKTMEQLKKQAAKHQILIEPAIVLDQMTEETILPWHYQDSKALWHLERNLFRYPYDKFQEEQNDIILLEAKDPNSEVIGVVLKIKRLLIEKDYRYRDFAIVSGDIETYGELIKREFQHAKIPCFVDEKKNILSNPMVEFIRAALEILEQNFTYESVFRFLRCGLVNIPENDLDLLENYVIALGVQGKSGWWKEFTRNYRTNYPVDLVHINELRKGFVHSIAKLYEVFHAKGNTVHSFIEGILVLLEEFRVEEQINHYVDLFKRARTNEAAQHAKEYEQIYRIVMEVFERIQQLLGADTLTIREFRDILETGLKEAKVGLIPPGVDQIVVGDIERTRLNHVKILFFLGVNDGIVPKTSEGGGILSDGERSFLQDHEFELAPTKRQRVFMSEFYLYLSLTKPQNKLYLSYARCSKDGKTLRASYLIGKLLSLYPKLSIRKLDMLPLQERDIHDALSTDYGLSYLIEGLKNYGLVSENALFLELFRMFVHGELPAKLDKYKVYDGLFYQNLEQGISKRAAKQLYGEVLLGSVTRMEQYAACAFSHFLKFGLFMEERPEYQIMIPDLGMIYHKALELFSLKVQDKGYQFRSLSEELQQKLGKECVLEATEDFHNGILLHNKRNEYMLQRVERVLLCTVKAVCEQISAGKFEPVAFEKSFSYADHYLNLRGRIDRLDIYEEENTIYLRVIDYKSGSTSFDLLSLYYGLQMQLSVYLSAAMTIMQQRYPEKQMAPGGIFYFNLDAPIVDKSDHVEEDIKKQLTMNGLVNAQESILCAMDEGLINDDDGLKPQVQSTVIPVETNKDGELKKNSSVAKQNAFDHMLTHVDSLIRQFSKEILEGRTRAVPYQYKTKNACTYCSYSSVCGFDQRIPGFRYHKWKDKSKEEIWTEIGKEGDLNE